jgi:hypothetical protein
MPFDFSGLAGKKTLARGQEYLALGLIPIPIMAGEKRPAYARWTLTSAEDAIHTIRRALADVKWGKELNLGVLCGKPSGVVVLDIDAREGGVSEWLRLVEKHGNVDTFTVRTGGGGYHLYFRYDRDTARLHTGVDTGIKGWDIRSDGGQVLGPGSIHPKTGNAYVPVLGFAESDGVIKRATFAPMPRWLLAILDDTTDEDEIATRALMSCCLKWVLCVAVVFPFVAWLGKP